MKTLHWLGALFLPGALALAGCTPESRLGPAADPRADDSSIRASTGTRRAADGTADARPARGSETASREGEAPGRYQLAYPTGVRQTSVLMLEVDSPPEVRVGRPYRYSVRVTNLTETPLHGVAVLDAGSAIPGATAAAEPAGTAAATQPRGEAARAASRPTEVLRGGGEAANGDANHVVWTIGTLGPKQSQTREFSGTADEVGTVHTCLAVTYNPALCIAVRATRPELEVVKSGPSDALICQEIPYTYAVRNVGTGNAERVVLEDRLPDGLVTAEGRSDVVTANLGTLREGETRNVTARLRAQRTGRFSSRASATMAGDEGDEDRAQSREVTTVVREPVLEVDVEGPEATYVGQPLNYRVTVRNTGDAPAERTALKLTSVGTTGRLADRDLGTIAPGASQSVDVSTRAGRDARAGLTATAEAVCARPASDEVSVEVRTIPALQLEVVDGEDPVQIGANTTYTINVRNEGSGPDRNVRLRGTLPAELQFVSAKGITRVTADGRNLTFEPLNELAAGDTATWQIVVKALRPADARFGLELNSTALGRPAVETEPTRIFDPRNPDAAPAPDDDVAPETGDADDDNAARPPVDPATAPAEPAPADAEDTDDADDVPAAPADDNK
jgi:uncharacterized repeat protein (TIGR01451 family)